MTKRILFDLDGTLTDSGEGILNCVELVLNHFGLPIPKREALHVFIGPPLKEMFPKFGVPVDRVDEAVAVYRSRYTTVGKYENHPYDGIAELLQTLKQQGNRLFVATSKPETMAIDILNRFELAPYFEAIVGATLDDSRNNKSAVIAHLLNTTDGNEPIVMVGDTAFDVIGAAEHGIPTIGVSWGYGQVEEMQRAGAAAIAHSPAELLEQLQTH